MTRPAFLPLRDFLAERKVDLDQMQVAIDRLEQVTRRVMDPSNPFARAGKALSHLPPRIAQHFQPVMMAMMMGRDVRPYLSKLRDQLVMRFPEQESEIEFAIEQHLALSSDPITESVRAIPSLQFLNGVAGLAPAIANGKDIGPLLARMQAQLVKRFPTRESEIEHMAKQVSSTLSEPAIKTLLRLPPPIRQRFALLFPGIAEGADIRPLLMTTRDEIVDRFPELESPVDAFVVQFQTMLDEE